jgi:methylmalonyl-CoA/ethylmalonyl-CoA epimerase
MTNEGFTLNHIGYITNDIAATTQAFNLLGYMADEIIKDNTQRTFICFLHKENTLNIELVQPFEDNKTMNRMLKKIGVMPYHLCYEVDDVDALYEEFVAKDWTPLFRPVASVAYGNRLICYFFNRNIGLIEMVNKTI